MPDKDKPEHGPDQHGQARHLAEKAQQAAAEGDFERAEKLRAQADRTDPEAVADVLDERELGPLNPDDVRPASDEEVAAITRTIQPKSDAPSRAGIVGPGSGADGAGVGTGGPTQKR
jgi:transcription elongation GreA/GreB family factor